MTTITATPKPQRTAWQWMVVGVQIVAAGFGAVFSYEFGLRISGLPLAVLLAANGAFFGAITVSFLADLVAGAWQRRDSGLPGA